ncbi:MAG TPA: hypothetical protein VMY37_00425 [Thermoguttaceae bacterium]|nr:hypothetical protein [Thermoguttaceae bacterium]
MKTTEGILARSEHYTVSHEYEVVLLDRPSGPQVVIGDFYGDPAAAIIDAHEKWAIVVGCGIVLYWLRKPFTPYEYDKKTNQWWEAHRSPPDEWWIETVYQVAGNTVRFVVDPAAAVAGVYELDVESLSIVKVIPKEESV